MEELTAPRSRYFNSGVQRTRRGAVSDVRTSRSLSDVDSGSSTWAHTYRARLRISDAVVVSAVVLIAQLIRFGLDAGPHVSADVSTRYSLMSFVVILVWLISLAAFQTRDHRVVGVGTTEYRRIVNASSTTFGLLAIVFLVAGADSSRWFFVVALPLGLLGLVANRWMWRRWLMSQRLYGRALSRVLVVGRLVEVENVARQIDLKVGAAYRVVGAVVQSEDADARPRFLRNMHISTNMDEVPDLAKSLGVDGVIIAGQPDVGADYIQDLAWKLEGSSAELILATSLANVAGPRIHFRPVDGLPLIHVEIPQFDGGKHLVKRLMDVALSGIALIVLSPVFLVIAVLIRLSDDGGTVFFSQDRVGRSGTTFKMYKFRSMVVDAQERLADLAELNESDGLLFKIKNDPRVTKLGRVLRKYSLDELPQLWNVLVGDMSIVGPRPPLPSEVLGYDDHVHRRLYIKPGLTGMWQVNGRSALTWDESVRFDLYYVENWSVIGDLVLMWRTIRVLIKPDGAY
jgi:exopolysaccharide biosynthesis polyprenyl glycosylphosphotransferase